MVQSKNDRHAEHWLQEGQTCLLALAQQPSPDVLSDHPAQLLLQCMSAGLIGNDIGKISSLVSSAQPHFDMTAGLITQVSQ